MSNRVVVSPERCLRAFKIYFDKLDEIVNQKLGSIHNWRNQALCTDFAERIMSVLKTNCPHLVDQITNWAPEQIVGISGHNIYAPIFLRHNIERPFQSEEQRSLYVMLESLQKDLEVCRENFVLARQEWKYSLIRVLVPKIHEELLNIVEVEDDKKKLVFRAKDLFDSDLARRCGLILKNVETQLILTEQINRDSLNRIFREAAICFLK